MQSNLPEVSGPGNKADFLIPLKKSADPHSPELGLVSVLREAPEHGLDGGGCPMYLLGAGCCPMR